MCLRRVFLTMCILQICIADIHGCIFLNQSQTCFTVFFIFTRWCKCNLKLLLKWCRQIEGEYRSLSNTFSQLRIQHRITCPYTSEQNGVAERRHHHVVDIGLTLLARAFMPLEYWSSAFSHAVHLINRLPTPVLQHQTPYERFYKALNSRYLGVPVIRT